jgi:type IV secretory pathway TraG/TraD family ATPase VirD4
MVPIGQTLEERRRHTYMIGATGTGKTTLLLQMIYQDLINGKGLAIIDPHGDLSKRILEIIPKNRLKDVVYFNPYDIEYPIGLNFLELPKGLSTVEKEREKDFITSSLISIFHKLYDARYSGPRMEHILRNVTLTALELENPTLFTIYELLTNRKYRKQVVDMLNNQVLKAFWKNEFNAQGSFQRAEQISPITNKLGRFLTTTMTRNILNQTKSKLDFNEIMDNKKILLCDLSKGKIGEDNSFFLGSLIIAKLELAAFRRINIPQNNRIDFFLYVDEFQNFATTTFAQVLSEARKYRLSAILAHQNTVQLESDLLDTIIGNSGTIISFRTSSPKDEDKILPVFSPQVEEGQIANLPSYHFYIKINALQPQDAFTGEIDDFTIKGNDSVKEKVVTYSREVYGTKITIAEQPSIQEMFTSNNKKKTAKNVNKFEMTK